MKIFAVLVIAAIVAYASADEATAPAEYIGDLQDTEGGDIVRIGVYSDCAQPAQSDDTMAVPNLPMSCRLKSNMGVSLCRVKCISRGHRDGRCEGKLCKCSN